MLRMTAERKGFRMGVDFEVGHRYLCRRPPGSDVLLTAQNDEQKPVAAALIVSFNGLASYLIGAGLPSGHPAFVRGASNLVQWEAMQWAKENKIAAYNLEGLDPKNNPGVYRFKERMNGKLTVKKGLWIWSGNALKRKVLGSIIQARLQWN